MTAEKNYTATITNEQNSTVKIEGEVQFAVLERYREAAVAKLGKDVKIDGFRPGHIPEKVLVEHVGEMAILNEMAERALSSVYPEIIKEHSLDVIGYPQISVTKLAAGNPLGFTAEVAVMPTFTLPDFKKLASNAAKESAEVTDEDLKKTIEDLLRQKMAYERLQKKAAAENKAKDADGVVDLPTPETVEEETPEDAPLPEITDEYVKTLGDFSSVEDFNTKLREHLTREKEQEVVSKHRAAITDLIVEQTEIDLPQVMIDAEINQMFGQMENDLTRSNLSIEDYLTHIKKTKEDLVAEWKPAAEKRAKLQLVLNQIAKEEKIEADKSMVDHEVDHMLSHYKDADPERVRVYVESMLKNEAVMKMLEEQSA